MPLQPSGRFGSAVAVLDFNKDGVPDLAVGAPSVGSDQLTYTVRLLLGAGVEQGGKDGGMGWEGRSQGEAVLDTASGGSSQPDVPGRRFGGR